MMCRLYGAFIALLGVAALVPNQTLAEPGAARNAGFASTRSMAHPSIAPSFRHHRRNHAGAVWPGVEDLSYGPSNGEPTVDAAPAPTNDIRYTYTYDVPWDWAHRYPPAVTPSDRPYVSSCPTETVRFPGRDGGEQSVNVMRCY
jgi:hypothetical protein